MRCYDIVVANILAEVLVPLTPVILSPVESRAASTLPPVLLTTRKSLVVETVKAAGLEVRRGHPSERLGIRDRTEALSTERIEWRCIISLWIRGQIGPTDIAITGSDVNHIRKRIAHAAGGTDHSEQRRG